MKSLIKNLLVSTNQTFSGYLIYLYYRFFVRAKEKNTQNKIMEITFTDIDFSDFFSFIFGKFN